MSHVSVEYMRTASRRALEDFMLGRLSEASRLRKRLKETLEELVRLEADASLASLLIEQDRLRDPLQHVFEFTEEEPLAMPEPEPKRVPVEAQWRVASG